MNQELKFVEPTRNYPRQSFLVVSSKVVLSVVIVVGSVVVISVVSVISSVFVEFSNEVVVNVVAFVVGSVFVEFHPEVVIVVAIVVAIVAFSIGIVGISEVFPPLVVVVADSVVLPCSELNEVSDWVVVCTEFCVVSIAIVS